MRRQTTYRAGCRPPSRGSRPAPRPARVVSRDNKLRMHYALRQRPSQPSGVRRGRSGIRLRLRCGIRSRLRLPRIPHRTTPDASWLAVLMPPCSIHATPQSHSGTASLKPTVSVVVAPAIAYACVVGFAPASGSRESHNAPRQTPTAPRCSCLRAQQM